MYNPYLDKRNNKPKNTILNTVQHICELLEKWDMVSQDNYLKEIDNETRIERDK